MKISFKSVLSVVTLAMVVLILYASRHQLEHAWRLLAQVNIWLVCLVAVFTIMSYLFSGEMIFSYLKQKKILKDVSLLTQMRVSLELNFVNHVLPSGGASGVAYTNWRMRKLGVSTSGSMMAQIVRFAAGFAATIVLLLVSLVVVTIDGHINRWIILMSALLIMSMSVIVAGFMFVAKSPTRIAKLSRAIGRFLSRIGRLLPSSQRHKLAKTREIEQFFDEFHTDYIQLNRSKKLLRRPFFWGLLFMTSDILIFFIAFLSLGAVVNPASILIAYCVASLAGFVMLTPGGAGGYEALMVGVLVIAGTTQSVAIAGILLARVIILLITIVVGYIFYQLTLNKYGKRPATV